MNRRWIAGLIGLLTIVSLSIGVAQERRRRGNRQSRTIEDRQGVEDWENDPKFKNDIFTFVRVQYSSSFRGYGRRGAWSTDWPDSDLNFSFRLQQLTSLKVNPDPIYLGLSDPALFDHPFIYMIEPGHDLYFTEDEVKSLRRYLDNGGFMMVDDFWGDHEWFNFYSQIKRVYDDREPVELPIDHPIFHLVYDLKEKPQVPSFHTYDRYGVTYERPYDPTTREVHFKGMFDDNGRMVMIICHNTDIGDGWEREGMGREYFTEFSEKKSYPMGINIVVYAMTH